MVSPVPRLAISCDVAVRSATEVNTAPTFTLLTPAAGPVGTVEQGRNQRSMGGTIQLEVFGRCVVTLNTLPTIKFKGIESIAVAISRENQP